MSTSSFHETIQAKMNTITNNKIKENKNLSQEERAEKLKIRQQEVRMKKFTELRIKYFPIISKGIENAANRGERIKYINFDRNDFKANCYGLGNPTEFQLSWFNEICNPKSPYLEDNGTSEDNFSFVGFTFEQIPNAKFTTKITW